jgi:4-amino-4-deoxy-L-arabinose transferase-like glycosyltransferase
VGLNSIFSALTCIPVYLIARRTIGAREARWAAWLWAFFPYAIYLSAGRIWENALTTLLLTTLIWFTLELEQNSSVLAWCGYGVLWAVAALTNPSTCAVLPPLGLWIAWRRHRVGKPWLPHAIVAALMFAAVLTPWEVRNVRTFHRFVPLRDNFWMEVRVGNTGDLSDIYPDWAHPGRSPRELEEYQRLGETAYLAHMRDVSLDFIRRYPGYFTWLTLKRVIYTWTGFWSTNPVYMKNEPFQFPNTFFCTGLTLLAFAGLRRLWRSHNEWTAIYIIPLLIYPLVYYVTHPGIDYRHPIDPLIAILVATAAAGFRGKRKAAHS